MAGGNTSKDAVSKEWWKSDGDKRKKVIYVYVDEGVSAASVSGWMKLLVEGLEYAKDLVRRTNASRLSDDLRAQRPTEMVLLVPGGADRAYVQRLGRHGVDAIRRAVYRGASYIGVCAGAYFASAACIFEAHDPSLRIVEPRALSLFPYPAIGAVIAGFTYASEDGASEEGLVCSWNGVVFEQRAYCNGGPAWPYVPDGSPWGHGGDRVIARYDRPALARHGVSEKRPAAVVVHGHGAGVAVLSGVHPELPTPATSNADDARTSPPQSQSHSQSQAQSQSHLQSRSLSRPDPPRRRELYSALTLARCMLDACGVLLPAQ